ncbi:MAG: nucleoside 2-deoxyribosyltransferase, partial [Acetobacteraceae bacterium]|nr:nucleoside 2-deoxyribosyltransferase [Acetobacteraceae bacterium]
MNRRDRPKLYLAGPDVFLPDAEAVGRRKRALCEAFGFEGWYPLDNEIESQGVPADTAMAIYRGNSAMMRVADAIVANLTPFRGPSADVGTAFELGFMAALGKPCFAYSNDGRPFLARARETPGLAPAAGGGWTDADGLRAEDFGLAENLMLDCALRDAGFPVVVQHCDG